MNLEENLGLAVSQLGQAREEILGLANLAQTQIARVGNASVAIINSQSKNLVIDPVNGNDNAEGNLEAPLKTIQQAIALVPRGGRVNCALTGDYDLSVLGGFNCAGRFVNITSTTATRHKLIFSEFIDDRFTPNLRNLNNIVLSDGAILSIRGLTIQWPESVHDASGLGITNSGMISALGIGDVSILACNINIPANPSFRLFNANDMVRLYWLANVVLAGSQPIAGNIHSAHTNTAGFDPLNSRLLNTNLAQI